MSNGPGAREIKICSCYTDSAVRGRPFNSWVGGGGGSDFEKQIPASACRKKNIACSPNVIETLWEEKGKKYPAHQIARKKFLMTRITTPSRVKWSAPNEFEDVQASTQVQWHDAELTVKRHLTDQLLCPMRTYCVLGYLLLEPHWSPTQRSIFARCIATQKQVELY